MPFTIRRVVRHIVLGALWFLFSSLATPSASAYPGEHIHVEWGPPPPITAGTPLGDAQLNAYAVDLAIGETAFVPGTFTYSPAAGAVLPAGRHELWVTFTPLDRERYPVVKEAWTILTVFQAGSASEVRPVANRADCTSAHEYGVDEVLGRVIGVGGTLPTLCDVETGQVLFTFPQSERPNGVAVDSGRRRVFATDYYQPICTCSTQTPTPW
jgi:hypothetical protein